MRLIFMGSSTFGLPALSLLYNSGYEIVGIYTQPPKPKGRGHQEQRTPIHQFGLEHKIPVFTPKTLRSSESQKELQDLNADLAIVAAYGLILPKAILETPKHGCWNIHASLLPRWRGAAPLQRAILAGDIETGVTIMAMNEGLDTGNMLSMESIALSPYITTPELHDTLSQMGGELLLRTLKSWLNGSIKETCQPLEGVTYAHKLFKEEGELLWSETAQFLERKVRAFTPWPGTWFAHKDTVLRVHKAHILGIYAEHAIGTFFHPGPSRVAISCQEGNLEILEIQRPGGKVLPISEFLKGFSFQE